MEDINEIFDEKTIDYYKNDKDLITEDLLATIRSYGNDGKKIALEILDLPKDTEQYYLDAFGNRISFNGNRRLKKAFTKLNMSAIHKIELRKCAEDIHYFKDNYVKIKTKQGVNFPDLRPYQDEFINEIIPDENEDNIGLMGRQCCSSGTTVNVINNSKEKDMTFEELFNECKKES